MPLLASSYPLLDVFWTMLWFFLFFIWIWLLITIFVDLFRTSVQDPDQAHVGSEFFPADDVGARDATEWLQEQGVEGVQIFPPAPSYSPRRRPPGIGYG